MLRVPSVRARPVPAPSCVCAAVHMHSHTPAAHPRVQTLLCTLLHVQCTQPHAHVHPVHPQSPSHHPCVHACVPPAGSAHAHVPTSSCTHVHVCSRTNTQTSPSWVLWGCPTRVPPAPHTGEPSPLSPRAHFHVSTWSFGGTPRGMRMVGKATPAGAWQWAWWVLGVLSCFAPISPAPTLSLVSPHNRATPAGGAAARKVPRTWSLPAAVESPGNFPAVGRAAPV